MHQDRHVWSGFSTVRQTDIEITHLHLIVTVGGDSDAQEHLTVCAAREIKQMQSAPFDSVSTLPIVPGEPVRKWEMWQEGRERSQKCFACVL